MAAGDLTDLATVKGWLALTSTVDDALIGRVITAASKWFRDVTHRDVGLGLTAYSEIRHGSGGYELYLAEPPVVSVQSLAVDAQPIPAQVSDGQPGYFLVNGEAIALEGYTFNRGRRNVRVSYTAGWSSVPEHIAQACVELVSWWYASKGRIGHVSKSIQGEVISFSQATVPPNVKQILGDFGKVVPL